MSKQNEVVVYWSVFAQEKVVDRQSLLCEPPKNFIKEYSVNRVKENKLNYTACKSYLDYFKNTYILSHPLDISVDLNNHFSSPFFSWFSQKPPSFHDSLTVDYDVSWIFFSESSVSMEVVPPFAHKTSAANQGFVTAGSFDISKWFRPVFLTYQMFPNQSGLVFKQGEPACYVKFNTSSKVVLNNSLLINQIGRAHV